MDQPSANGADPTQTPSPTSTPSKAGTMNFLGDQSKKAYGPTNPQGGYSLFEGPGMLRNVARSIASPFVKAGVTGISAAKAGYKLVTGDQAGAEEALKGMNVPGFGQVAPAKIGTDVEDQMKDGKGPLGMETVKTIGTGAEIAATLAPGGGEASSLLKGGEAVAATVAKEGAEQVVKEGAEVVGKEVVKKTLGQAVKQGTKEAAAVGAAAGFGGATQKEGATGADIIKGTLGGAATGAVVGAGLPLAQAGIGKLASMTGGHSNLGARVINSIIKPLKKDFSYGANPGRTVAAEGITGNTLEELAENISKRRQEIGQQISETAAKAKDKVVDISDSLSPLDKAIEEAKKNPRTNQSVIKRLEDTKNDLLGLKTVQEEVPTGQMTPGERPITKTIEKDVPSTELTNLTPEQAVDFKRRIGDMTKWTGNTSDDEAVNKALKRVYGNIKDKVNEAVPELKAMNEKYADLTSAETAAKYRNVIEQRQSIIKMGVKASSAIGAILGAATTGGPGALIGAGAGLAFEKALESPAVMTRAAAWLARAEPEEKEVVFKTYPAFRNALLRYLNDDGSTKAKPKSHGRSLR